VLGPKSKVESEAEISQYQTCHYLVFSGLADVRLGCYHRTHIKSLGITALFAVFTRKLIGSDMSEEQTNFKVTDRRLFNADGTPRELTPDEKQPIAPPEAVKLPDEARPDQPVVQLGPEAAATTPTDRALSSATAAQHGDEEVEEFDVPDASDPASFVNFIMSIASNAASAVGMMEHPVTHKREVDLELAKHWIDVLGMLQEKTRGNLTTQEQKILEGLLADLRMQYVSLTHSPQAKAARPFTGRDIIGGK
jgi:hypothetical protein